MEKAIDKVVRIMGGQSKLARALGITPQAVQQWVSDGRVSHKRVVDVSRKTGVPCHELRPDLYPVD